MEVSTQMINEIRENIFNAPAQIRCIPTSYKEFGRSAIVNEALTKYPGMAEEFNTRCKLWGKLNIGDVFFFIIEVATV